MNEKGPCLEEISGDINNNPSCPHGPTLLFSRKHKNELRKFYACSACRDRKLCSFFHWADVPFSEATKNAWNIEKQKFIGNGTHKQIYNSTQELKSFIGQNQVAYCHTCSKFVMLSKATVKHKDHDLDDNISADTFKSPLKLLKPLECDKKEAQYLFSRSSLNLMINVAKENDKKSVICIGAPKVHEFIQNDELMDSILLDFDRRYLMFYPPSKFCWYNAFNNHFFFGSKAKQHFIDFLKGFGNEGMIILDPPFGGRLEPLAVTLRNIQELFKQLNPLIICDIPVFLIYPYFMEQHVTTCLPTFRMVDYIVTYENHPQFCEAPLGQKSKSPVRIFTNMNLSNVKLPIEEGYRFCKICERWVCDENKHCEYCDSCPSKNGSTYVHCFKCKMCVKPSWKHCRKCKRCCLETHDCILPHLLVVKCHNCGEEGHKLQNCNKPNNFEKDSTIVVSGKRKQTFPKMKNNKRKKYNMK